MPAIVGHGGEKLDLFLAGAAVEHEMRQGIEGEVAESRSPDTVDA